MNWWSSANIFERQMGIDENQFRNVALKRGVFRKSYIRHMAWKFSEYNPVHSQLDFYL